MTRQYFEAMALTLKAQDPGGGNLLAKAQWQRDCEAIATCLNNLNSRFDGILFLRNCGVPDYQEDV